MIKYKFRDYPKKKPIKFYDNNRKKIKKIFKEDENILSIYEYGQTKAPGISDLDIIIVFKNKTKKKILNKKKYDFINIDNELYDLIKFGNVIKMDSETFKNIQYFDKFNLSLIYGKKLNYIKPSQIEAKLLVQISINDWIPERILRLQNIINNKTVNISNSLCVLNSLCYSLKSIKKFIGYKKNINLILKETNILRRDWHKIKNIEVRLIKLINFSIFISKKYYHEYSIYFSKFHTHQLLHKKYKEEIKYEIIKNNYIIFTNNINKILEIEKKSTKNNIYISKSFYSHFAELANQKNSISRTMKKKYNYFNYKNTKLNLDYKKLLIKKINLAENNKKFLRFVKISKGLIRYGYNA